MISVELSFSKQGTALRLLASNYSGDKSKTLDIKKHLVAA